MKYRPLYYSIASLSIASLLFLAACRDEPKNPEGEDDGEDSVQSVATVDTGLSATEVQSFTTSGFADYAKKRSPAFDWSKFKLKYSWEEDSAHTSDFKPNQQYFTNYGPFLKYSPDSTYFIDLDSYNVDIKKDSKGKFIASELGPDCEVSLINRSTGKKSRLLFMGPGGSVEDASWLSKDELILLGVQENNEGRGKQVSVWKYNLPTATFTLYELPDTTLAKQLINSWRRERLKGVVLR